MLPDPPPPAPEGPPPRPPAVVLEILAAGAPYSLLLSGGLAVRAHGLLPAGGPDRDLEFVTGTDAPMAEVADALGAWLTGRGLRVGAVEAGPLAARLVVTDPESGLDRAVDVRKETLWRPAVESAYGPVPAEEDVVGLAVRALADLGLAGSLVDVRAASARWSHVELEELARRHTVGAPFDLTDLQARLARSEWLDDGEFAAYGLDDGEIQELRRWAQEWVDDIAERLIEEAPFEDPETVAEATGETTGETPAKDE
ncbi:hypothetical protein M1P56_34605 [Streptomyces sp. HU2014]|uniref:Transcriptional regulatory protein DevR n=1 Tax=Streptomyces albireticuli TaxID=1940 RepID=A0A1Z2L4I7_9ACTN|nr:MULTISPECIES: hypothetical protein [Streptomyces]ARZ69196.1 transcriptional regulatory protein DevR [Streptomyces albireticuli]UQI49081.1 hypothetical protein M1P56_34605 [Streptomyces sp. HU2014]